MNECLVLARLSGDQGIRFLGIYFLTFFALVFLVFVFACLAKPCIEVKFHYSRLFLQSILVCLTVMPVFAWGQKLMPIYKNFETVVR